MAGEYDVEGDPAEDALKRSVAGEIVALLKSPLRRSANATVLLEPSVTSVTRKAVPLNTNAPEPVLERNRMSLP